MAKTEVKEDVKVDPKTLNEDGMVKGAILTSAEQQKLALKRRKEAPIVDESAEALKAIAKMLQNVK